MLKKIIMLFIISISFSNTILIKTDLNEINIYELGNKKVEVLEENVSRNKKGNKDGKVYIKTKNNYDINAVYKDGKLNGKLIATNKLENIKMEIDYKDNYKNGKFLVYSDKYNVEINYLFDLKHGLEKIKFSNSLMETNYFYDKKNGDEIYKYEDGKIIYLNRVEDQIKGKVKEVFPDGVELEYFVDEKINGELTLKIKEGLTLKMFLFESFQIGDIIVEKEKSKKIYNDILILNKEYEIFKYLPKDIVFLKKNKENNFYVSKIRINGILRTFKYSMNENYLDGNMEVVDLKENKIIQQMSVDINKGNIDGKVKILKKDNCNMEFTFKNNMKNGKYIYECDEGISKGEYRDSKLVGKSFDKNKIYNYDVLTEYKDGIEIFKEAKGKGIYYNNKLIGNKWYINEEIFIDNENIKHEGVIEGNKSIHKLYLNGILKDIYEGSEKELPEVYQILNIF